MLTASSSTTAIKLLKIATFRFDIRFDMGVTMRDRSLIRQVSLWMGVILPLALAVPAWPATLTVTPRAARVTIKAARPLRIAWV